jgi:hypothetical protein
MTDKEAAAMWMAWREMNSIRARDGVPYGHHGGYLCQDVPEWYWSAIVDALAVALGDECLPWPSERMKPHLPMDEAA